MRILLLAILVLAGAAQAADQAGVSAAVRGQVALARSAAVGRQLQSGEPIFLQDALTSGPRSGMQILLLDETIFTLGPESELVVDEFVYDPSTKQGKVNARVTKGVFRFVTGWIPKQNPKDLEVKLPTGTLGVRGTIVGGSVDPVTKKSLLVLLGEGADNDTGSPPGAFEACNAGACQLVKRAGFGVTIGGPEEPPSEPFRVPLEDVLRITGAVSDPEGAVDVAAGLQPEKSETHEGMSEKDPRAPAEVAGSGGTVGEAELVRMRLQGIDRLDGVTADATQDARGLSDIAPIPDDFDPGEFFAGGPGPGPSPAVLAGFPNVTDVTRLDQLVQSGSQGQGTALYGRQIRYADGGYDFSLNVDLGERTANLLFDNIQSSKFGIRGGRLQSETSFTSLPAFAAFGAQGRLGTACEGPCPAVGVALLLNQPGVADSAAQVFGVGEGLSDPRFEVLTPADQRLVPRSNPTP